MYTNGFNEPAAGAKVPDRVRVSAIVSSRYRDHRRPASWDLRREGVDVIRTDDGRELKLLSDGGQSPPQRGWQIMLTGGDEQSGFQWTLYGIPQGADL